MIILRDSQSCSRPLGLRAPKTLKHPFQVGNNVYFLTLSKTHKKSVVADLISTFIHLSVVLYPINIKKTEPIFYVRGSSHGQTNIWFG